jgi:hypothetical protein
VSAAIPGDCVAGNRPRIFEGWFHEKQPAAGNTPCPLLTSEPATQGKTINKKKPAISIGFLFFSGL